MNFKEKEKQLQSEARVFHKSLGKEMSAFREMHNVALEDKALSKKTKELIALGISVAVKCEPCIIAHVRALVKLDASRDEIIETLGVCSFMGGGPANMYGAKALACFDEFIEE